MSSTRVFLLSPALARLIERDRAGERVRQGYFPEQPDRRTHVKVTGENGHLILVSHAAKGPSEDAAAISLAQAEALLGLTGGQIEYLGIALDLGNHVATIQRLLTPGPLDLISVTFKHDKAARAFQPPAWFGPEVSADPSYRLRAIALDGLPAVPEVEVSNAALISLLDSLDHRDEEAKPRAARHAPPASSEPGFDAEDEQELEGLTIEDSVLRDLARSLQPQER
jgi:CYTH domain-containing protein